MLKMPVIKFNSLLTILTLVSLAASTQTTNISQYNSTEYHHDGNPSNETVHVEIPPPPPIWCPGNSRQMVLGSDYFYTCQPTPCLLTDINHPNVSVINNHTAVVNFNDTSRRICAIEGFSKQLNNKSCIYARLTGEQFKLNYTDGSLHEYQTNSNYKLGEYYYYPDAGEVVVCRQKRLSKDVTEDVIIWCSIHQMNLTESSGVYPNGSVYLNNIDRVIRRGFYNIDKAKQSIDVCLPVKQEMRLCKHSMDIYNKYFRLQPNLSLWTNDGLEIVYEAGNYFMDVTYYVAVVCINAGEPRRQETRDLYAAAYIISSIFAFLTLLAHLFYPHLNYHAKALLCHIISLLIMYITMTVRSFVTDYNSDFGRLLLFGLQYVSALATFLWLNVLAFELWRVFSNLQGNTSTLGPQQAKKRWFIAKCCYAWGIPMVLCLLIIGLSYDSTSSNYFDLPFARNVSWFQSDKTMFYFFYLPIIIILIENVVFFGLTIWHIRSASRGTDILNKKVSKQLFRVCVKLFVVMGIFWFAEVISWQFSHEIDEAVWYVTDLINALQGVAIFLVYVCKRSTWKMLKKRWKGQKGGSQNSKSTSSTSGERTRKISNISNSAITMTNIRTGQNER
ncbi:hypothetical protein CHUAL_007649 [Chamberlinius hualienensis]